MGEVIEQSDEKSVNVQLNIVPFIDLMSCMTAFLLVTAVWVSIAQLDVRPSGRTAAGIDPPENPELSVLIESDAVWIGVSRVNEFERIPALADGQDWARVEERLAAHKGSAWFADTKEIQIAAESPPDRPVRYQALVATMDLAVKAGFTDVRITDPRGLAAYPHL